LWKNIFVSISESQSQSIAVVVTVVTSKILNSEPDESSLHTNLDISKISFNISPLNSDNFLTSDFQTKYVGIVSHAPKILFSKFNYDFLQPCVNVSMLLQNVFLSMVLLNSSVKLKLNITFKNIFWINTILNQNNQFKSVLTVYKYNHIRKPVISFLMQQISKHLLHIDFYSNFSNFV